MFLGLKTKERVVNFKTIKCKRYHLEEGGEYEEF